MRRHRACVSAMRILHVPSLVFRPIASVRFNLRLHSAGLFSWPVQVDPCS
jgi:hypothetical protein